MSSTRTAPRTTMTNKSTHHTNGSGNSYDMNDPAVTSEFDSNLQRSVLMKNASQSDGLYRNPRFIHVVTTGLLGQPVVVQTSEPERYHGILETISPNGDIVLTVSHRLDNSNNNDIMALSTSLIDLSETTDSSVQSFELLRRTVHAPTIVEIIGIDIDLSGGNKCILEESSKVSQLEDDRFNRMQHFYDADEIDSSTLEYLDLGDDGKAGYDPEDMFHTNREKFNTTTDFDESKYTNVPLRQMTVEQNAEIDKHVMEIERSNRFEDVDEDDAGVKRPSEYNTSHNNDDGNSNPKSNQSSRLHMNERRGDSRYEGEYSSKRGNWRDQRGGGTNNRRGGPNNFSMNNPKQNQRSEQTQYTTSRSSEQAPNSRQQPYKSRNNRFNDNRSPHEGRDSPLQVANDETARGQRINSGSFSQGPNSGPTSPSTTLPTRGGYSANNRQLIGRNSPAPYTGSSSSRNNSTAASSPPPGPSSYQSNQTGGAGNYQQQSNVKMIKKQSRNEQQSTNDDTDQPKQQRNQQPQQTQQSSSNNQSNTVPLSRPSHLHTQQMKQPAQQQQQQPQQHQIQSSSSSANIPPPLSLPNQDDHPSSHETINSNPSDPGVHTANAPVYTSQTSGPGNAKANPGLNPEAEEFVPVHTARDGGSRPESRGASTNLPMPPFVSHSNSQALHLLQQQQQQQQQIPQNPNQQPSMIQPTHPQNATALYSPYYPTPYTNMAPFVGAAPQQMNAGMLGTSMMPPTAPPQLAGNGPNPNNVGPGGMTTPNSGSGPGYKPNNNPAHGGNTGNSGNTNVGPKKAVVSVQGNEQSNIAQQQQQVSQQMIFPGQVRYYPQEFQSQQTTPSSMQIPIFYPLSTSGMIPTAGVPSHQNIMISSAGSSGGPTTPAPTQIYYQGIYPGVDPRMYGLYPQSASVGPGGVNSNWPMTRSPPHQQQQQPNEQQRSYGGGQNIVTQAPPPSGVPNPGGGGSIGRSASASGPPGPNGANGGGPPMTPQYALSGNVPGYTYGPQAWYPAQGQVSSPQTNMPPQVGAYGMVFDPNQQGLPQQTAYVHPNSYDPAYFQQAPQQPPQQGLDTVPPGSYNR